MKALVLGCGEMGKSAINDLYFYGEFSDIIIGTRNLREAQKTIANLQGENINVSAEKIVVPDESNLSALFNNLSY